MSRDFYKMIGGIAFLIIVTVVLSLLKLPWYVVALLAVATAIYGAVTQTQVGAQLTRLFRHASVRMRHSFYAYDLRLYIKVPTEPTTDGIQRLVDEFLREKDIPYSVYGLRGYNYLQFALPSPAETVQITWSPHIRPSDDGEDIVDGYSVVVSTANPHTAMINQLGDRRVERLIMLMANVASRVASTYGGKSPEINITVNRLAKDEMPRRPLPPLSPERTLSSDGSVLVRDAKQQALQIFTKHPEFAVEHLRSDIEDLVPVTT